MHPALSVLFFTSVGGAGFGLLGVLGVLLLCLPDTPERAMVVVAAATGGLLAAAGLIASSWHLGRPLRAWRALSQWRSSWLSREALVALATFVPLVAIVAPGVHGLPIGALRLSAAALALLAIATVVCTARIYTSLPPIPAWRHRRVLPGYLGFAALSGLLWWQWLNTLLGSHPVTVIPFLLPLLGVAMALLKSGYWRAIDRAPWPVDLPSATGLRGASGMRPFEPPHTETSYLLQEMGYVLARRHRQRLRTIAITLIVAASIGGATATLLPQLAAAAAGGLVVVLLQAGVFVERWLFFAEARHVVTVYYRG